MSDYRSMTLDRLFSLGFVFDIAMYVDDWRLRTALVEKPSQEVTPGNPSSTLCLFQSVDPTDLPPSANGFTYPYSGGAPCLCPEVGGAPSLLLHHLLLGKTLPPLPDSS